MKIVEEEENKKARGEKIIKLRGGNSRMKRWGKIKIVEKEGIQE